ncbi:hypothetical protein BV20DRAFT_954147 [Pilatotrama ljubarskyi]|nr:hypothetical protein BV20DRAFT_954147 [Pilatotrama ljubarskyi]
MAPISVLATNLATVCVESALWGVFFVLGVTTLVLLVRRTSEIRVQVRSPRRLRRPVGRRLWRTPLFVASCILLCTVTAHWLLMVYRLFGAFVYFKGGSQPTEYFASLRDPTEVALTALNVISVVICDLMVIARTWVIWSRALWVVIFPATTTVGLAVCSSVITYLFSQYDSDEDLYASTLGRWITAGCFLTIGTNVYGTAMISYRILSTNRALNPELRTAGSRSITGALAIFVESAALYATWALLFFATYQAKSSINVLMNDCLPAVSGISLMLITVRIGLGWSHRRTDHLDSSSHAWAPSVFEGGTRAPAAAHRDIGGDTGFELHAIALEVARKAEQADLGMRRYGKAVRLPVPLSHADQTESKDGGGPSQEAAALRNVC